MKKSTKLITAIALSAVAACGAFGLSGCAERQTVTGSMNYTQYGTNYGIKVSVEVEADKKGDRIRKVTILDSDYVSASPDGWDGKADWDKNIEALLLAYRGEYVEDILAKEVVTSSDGAPVGVDSADFKNFGDEFIITGATVGSGRLLIAVQDALKQLNK